ncbi:MAG TPA: hypothetical protein VER33_17935 [Polyangiaceae bacterium]|nr:hypothetical protein [Polyangiaceae bacterium]
MNRLGQATSRKVRLLCGLGLLVACLFWPLAARAQSVPRRTAIAVVSGGADTPFSLRLKAELLELGWRAIDIEPEADLALAQIARRAGTLAVLRVGKRAEGIEVWVAPEVDAEASSEWIDIETARPELAVLRAVEALRARFVELGLEPEGTAAATPVPLAQPPPPAPPRALRLWLGARAAVSWSPGGSSEIPYAGALVRWLPTPLGAVVLELAVPVRSGQVHGIEGRTSVRPFVIAALAEPQLTFQHWHFVAGLGAALALIELEGHPAAGYAGRSDTLVTGLALARTAAQLRLARRWQLRFDVTYGIAAPRPVVRFDERVAAVWGRPLLLAGINLQWAIFGE